VISRPIKRKSIKFCFKILFYFIRENSLLYKFTLRWNLLQKYWITLLILLYIIIRIFCIWLLYFLRFIPKYFLEILQDIKSKNTLHNFNLCFKNKVFEDNVKKERMIQHIYFSVMENFFTRCQMFRSLESLTQALPLFRFIYKVK